MTHERYNVRRDGPDDGRPERRPPLHATRRRRPLLGRRAARRSRRPPRLPAPAVRPARARSHAPLLRPARRWPVTGPARYPRRVARARGRPRGVARPLGPGPRGAARLFLGRPARAALRPGASHPDRPARPGLGGAAHGGVARGIRAPPRCPHGRAVARPGPGRAHRQRTVAHRSRKVPPPRVRALGGGLLSPPEGRARDDPVPGRAMSEMLGQGYPAATCALRHQMLPALRVATILSAQSTDARVNIVTPTLFAKYRSAWDLAGAAPAVLEQEIHSTGFFRNKTKSIIGMAQGLLERHGGEVPDTMEALVQLPGVGRKTANVVLGTWFRKNEGIVVDTHVQRLSTLLGLTREKDPVKIERDLMALVPRDRWTWFSHTLILHGRRVCIARRPRCEICVVNRWCPSSRV